MTEKKQRLLESCHKATEKVAKIDKTLQRHLTKLDKLLNQLEKEGYGFLRKHVEELEHTLPYPEWKEKLKAFNDIKWSEDGKSVPQYANLCDLDLKLEDIRSTYRKLADAERILENWKVKYATEAAYVQTIEDLPQIVVDFLDKWEQNVLLWLRFTKAELGEAAIKQIVKDARTNLIDEFIAYALPITGRIYDAKELEVAEKGELTGTFIGEKGTIKIQTISAGGYNIQKFHYRTLIYRVKEGIV